MCLAAVSHWDQRGAANWSVLSVAADPCPLPFCVHRTVWLTGNIGLVLFPGTTRRDELDVTFHPPGGGTKGELKAERLLQRGVDQEGG